MKWSPPRIERRKLFPAASSRLHMTLVCLVVGSTLTSGCATLPAMSPRQSAAVVSDPKADAFTPDELARIAAMPIVPVFDTHPESAVAAQASPVVTGLATSGSVPVASLESTETKSEVKPDIKVESMDVPKPIDPAPSNHPALGSGIAKNEVPKPVESEQLKSDLVKSDVAKVDAAGSGDQNTDATKPESAKSDSVANKSETAAAPRTDIAMGGGAGKNPSTRSDSGVTGRNAGTKNSESPKPRVAASKPSGVVVKPPESFAWKKSGKSTGDRPFQTIHLGDEGYRTLVLGSVGGNDPLALELIDRLSRHLHEDSIILGGFDCTIVRTINPDGEANRKLRNEKGDYVNSGFPKALADVPKVNMAEAKFVLDQIDALKPQRIVHIRSIEGGTGVVATGFSSQTAAREASEWLKFKLLMLPERSKVGSLERYVSTSGLADMITIGIPDTTPRDEVWSLYGDTVMNLLLAEDFASREIARKQ